MSNTNKSKLDLNDKSLIKINSSNNYDNEIPSSINEQNNYYCNAFEGSNKYQIENLNILNSIIDEIVNKKIFLKLKNNLSLYIDGRIIRYSELIKLFCCNNNFDYKLVFNNIDRKILTIIIEFFEINNWKVNPFSFETKFPELDCWLQFNKHHMEEVKIVANYLRIYVINNFFDFYYPKENLIIRENGFFKTFVNVDNKILENQNNSNYINNINKQNNLYSKNKESNKTIAYNNIPNLPSNINSNNNHHISLSKFETKDFNLACPPDLQSGDLSLTIPLEIYQVKLNANKNNTKSKFNLLLQDVELDCLIDAMICDSFWLVVICCRISNTVKDNLKDNKSQYLLIDDIFKRLSQNYFNFFIKLCEISSLDNKLPVLKKSNIMSQAKFNKSSNNEIDNNIYKSKENSNIDVCKIKDKCLFNDSYIKLGNNNSSKIMHTFKKDSILDAFHDYMSQCVFYSLYLAFPKSRTLFDFNFRQFLTSFFGYMYNGLNIYNKYNTDHWELDLGSGNIIEDETKVKNSMSNIR